MSHKEIRYGAVLGALRRHQRQINFNELVRVESELPSPRGRLRAIDLHRLLTPYVSVRFGEQARAVVPLALLLFGFLTLVLRTSPREAEILILGIAAVMLGLMFFMEGVKQGLMPFAENIGFLMPGRSHPLTLLGFGLLLGVAATFAEPAIGALQAAGVAVSAERAGLLKALLGPQVNWLVLAVALGVGLAVTLGLLRFMFGWRLKSMVLLIVPLLLGLTVYAASQPAMKHVIGLAWDCGGITTGPVTVPLVLAVGIGVAASAGRGGDPLSGFGIVTLASLMPVAAVLLVAIHFDGGALAMPAVSVSLAWYQITPMKEVLGAVRAIVPLLILLFLAQRVLLRQRLQHPDLLAYGLVLALLGMMLFNLGLTAGLVELGNQAGGAAPWAFLPRPGTGAAPLFPRFIGVSLLLLFSFCIGYGATVAEPALGAMGLTVENLTDGAIKKRLLVHAVALGVGLGAGLGVARILFNLPLAWLLVGAYSLALALTIAVREEYVGLAWDSAGVTTGPVTVPLLLSLGVGLSEAVGASEGFGILALCSVGPIISVLGFGLLIDRQSQRRRAGGGT